MMWPFSVLQRRRQETAIRKAFSRYVPPETLKKLLNDPSSLKPQPPERGLIWFLLVQMQDHAPADGSFKLGAAIDRMVEAELLVSDIMCSVVLATAGLSIEESATGEHKIRSAAAQLVEQFGSEARAIFGCREGWIGNYGGGIRSNYGPMLPGFGELLAALCETPYGTAREI
jgi:hypothetical protein